MQIKEKLSEKLLEPNVTTAAVVSLHLVLLGIIPQTNINQPFLDKRALASITNQIQACGQEGKSCWSLILST